MGAEVHDTKAVFSPLCSSCRQQTYECLLAADMPVIVLPFYFPGHTYSMFASTCLCNLLSLPLFLLVSSWLYCLWALSFLPSCCPSYQLWEHSLFMTWLVMRLFRSKGKGNTFHPQAFLHRSMFIQWE
jgi:hypothetical protein